MDISKLAAKLHEINLLELSGNTKEVRAAVDILRAQLKPFHLDILWDNDPVEWAIHDTLAYGREEM